MAAMEKLTHGSKQVKDSAEDSGDVSRALTYGSRVNPTYGTWRASQIGIRGSEIASVQSEHSIFKQNTNYLQQFFGSQGMKGAFIIREVWSMEDYNDFIDTMKTLLANGLPEEYPENKEFNDNYKWPVNACKSIPIRILTRIPQVTLHETLIFQPILENTETGYYMVELLVRQQNGKEEVVVRFSCIRSTIIDSSLKALNINCTLDEFIKVVYDQCENASEKKYDVLKENCMWFVQEILQKLKKYEID